MDSTRRALALGQGRRIQSLRAFRRAGTREMGHGKWDSGKGKGETEMGNWEMRSGKWQMKRNLKHFVPKVVERMDLGNTLGSLWVHFGVTLG